MPEKTHPKPEDYHTVTPHLTIADAAGAIDWYEKALGATQIKRYTMPNDDSTIMHAQIRIGDSYIMIGEEFPDYGCLGPKSLGGSPVTISLYVEDTDAAFERAVAAGAEASMPPTDMFWGDRYARIVDPYGHIWAIATHVRDVSEEEMMAGAAAMMAAEGSA